MQFTAGTEQLTTLETRSTLRRLGKWEQILASYRVDDDDDDDDDDDNGDGEDKENGYQHEILFVAWMIGELGRVDQYGMLIRVRYSCAQGHEWVRDTLRAHMELEVDSAHEELADVVRTFTRPRVVRGVLAAAAAADRCHFCERMHAAEVRQRRTLAEQPGDIIVIKLVDNASRSHGGPLYLNEELRLEACLFDSEQRVDEGLSNVFTLCGVVLVRKGAPVRWRTNPSLSDYICVFKRMGAWQISYDNDFIKDDFLISFDSTLSLQQNIKEWEAVHGRMSMCSVVYERISAAGSTLPLPPPPPSQSASAAARSAHMLTAFEIGSDILHTTLSIQEELQLE